LKRSTELRWEDQRFQPKVLIIRSKPKPHGFKKNDGLPGVQFDGYHWENYDDDDDWSAMRRK
jgi:hypothetical protein